MACRYRSFVLSFVKIAVCYICNVVVALVLLHRLALMLFCESYGALSPLHTWFEVVRLKHVIHGAHLSLLRICGCIVHHCDVCFL